VLQALKTKTFAVLKYIADKGFFHLLSVNFLIQFLGFGTSLLVTKFLKPEQIGQIKILQSYTAIFWILAGFGFNSAILKFCSEERSDQEREGILLRSLLLSLTTIAVSFSLLVILALTGVITSSQHLANWLIIYALVIPFGVFTDNLITYLQSLKKIKQMARAQGIIKVQSFILIVLSTWVWGFPGFIFATIAAYILGLVPLLWQVGFGFIKSKLTALPLGYYNIIIFSLLANTVGTIKQYGDIFILDHFAQNRVEIGFYSLATIFVLAATQIITTVQLITTPYFSEKAADKAWFRRKLIYTQIQTTGLSFGVAIGVYFLAWILVTIFYGSAYHSTLSYLGVLLLKYICWSSSAILGVALFALGKVNLNFWASLIATVIGLYLSYLFLQWFGIIGVAWAQVITALINLLISSIITTVVLRPKDNIISS
jgi:O-antigen/teichoic acid export membrane protein